MSAAAGPCDKLVLAARDRCLAGLARVAPQLGDAGARLIERLPPANWTMEWYLPCWLGAALDLPGATVETLVACNLGGLGYVRLIDDLADGDVPADQRALAACLAAALYQQVIRQYAELFPPNSTFWASVERWLGDWVRATLADGRELTDTSQAGADDARLAGLAGRGAPLKIGCAAACLLAGRAGLLPALALAVDHALVAGVLIDHALDWQSDLAAGRYNALVAAASPLPQCPEQREANRSQTLGWLIQGAGPAAYFAEVDRRLAAAQQIVAGLQVNAWADFLARLAQQAADYGRYLAEEPRAQVRRAAAEIFGDPSVAAPGSGPRPDAQGA